MTVQQLAKIIRRNPQAVREWLKKPDCPVGTAERREGSEHYYYIIYDKKVRELFCVTSSESQEQP